MTDGELTWPSDFYDIGGKTFEWTWKNKKDWCEFTNNEMSKATGLFKKWKDFVHLKNKDGTNQKTERERKTRKVAD